MHELSIAISLVDVAGEEARRLELTGIRSVHVKLGALSGVVKESLRLAFELARDGSLLDGADLVIEDVPVTIHCPTCGGPSLADSVQQLRCARCGTLSGDVIGGRELELVGLEVDQ